MKGKEFDFIRFINSFNRLGIRYLLIGGQAVIQYGAPVFTFDFDLWVHPEDKGKVIKFLQKGDFEIDTRAPQSRPVVKAYYGGERVDLFFARGFINMDGERIDFEDCCKRAVIKREPGGRFYIVLCPVDALIKLKKMRRLTAKDREQIRYLKEIINEREKG